MIFEISVKLEIGRKFENCLKSASGFFRDGDKAATFNALGILPVEKDKLTNLVIVGSNTKKQPFRTIAGKGSKTQDLEEGLHANTFTSSWLTLCQHVLNGHYSDISIGISFVLILILTLMLMFSEDSVDISISAC